MYRSIGLFLGLVSGAAACATDSPGGSDDATSEVAAAITSTCSYTIQRDKITVVKGEGGADPALELDVDTIVHHDGTTSTVNFAGTIKTNASNTTDVTMFSASVPSGTVVTHAWDVDATEFDTFDADDHGTGGGTLTFTCTGTGTQTDSDQVALGNAIIDVQVKATW
jgi:hypothetical protein